VQTRVEVHALGGGPVNRAREVDVDSPHPQQRNGLAGLRAVQLRERLRALWRVHPRHEGAHLVRSFGEHLERVARAGGHHREDGGDERKRHALLKQIAH
jgi:hypothetical protein